MRSLMGKNGIVVGVICLLLVGLGSYYFWSARPLPSVAPCYSEAPSGQCVIARDFQTTSAHHPARGMFVGFTPDIGLDKLIADLVALLRAEKLMVPLTIVYPADEQEATTRELAPYVRHSDIRMVQTQEREGIWVQDYMDLWYSNAKDRPPVIVDLPYRVDEGEAAPTAIATSCALKRLTAPPVADTQQSNGTYGGNLDNFAGVNVFGSGTSPDLLQFYAKQQPLPQWRVTTHWLRSSHLDELYALVPNRTAKGRECPFALLRASPMRWQSLLKQHPAGPKSPATTTPGIAKLFDECLTTPVKQKKKGKSACDYFWLANQQYEELIVLDAQRLAAKLEQQAQCTALRTLAVPVIFRPQQIQERYGTELDDAVAVYANAINGISVSKLYVTAVQPLAFIQDDIESQLKSVDVQVRFLNAEVLHQMGGGLHCWSQVIRSCQ